MTKSEIIRELSEKSELSKKEILYIVDNFLKNIKESISRDEQVEIRGFGTFYKNEKKARKVHSPIAGKILNVPAKSTMCFKASKIVEKHMNKD